MITKRELDLLVATNLSVPRTKVSAITSELIAVIKQALIDGEEVRIDGLGSLRVHTGVLSSVSSANLSPIGIGVKQTVPLENGIRNSRLNYIQKVCFSKAKSFSKLLRGGDIETMEKYGVDEQVKDQEALEKKAAQGCPNCGGPVTRHGSILICAKCGSQPFESENK
jgi:ribosomal protein S27AE